MNLAVIMAMARQCNITDQDFEDMSPGIGDFAQLIVDKCLEFSEPMPGSGDPEDRALERTQENIKAYFGVK